MKPELIKFTEELVEDITGYITELRDFLAANDVPLQNETMKELIDSVKSLRVMLKDKVHMGISFDENGYIVKATKIKDFVDFDNDEDIPADLAFGYYQLVDGECVIDEERQRQLEDV